MVDARLTGTLTSRPRHSFRRPPSTTWVKGRLSLSLICARLPQRRAQTQTAVKANARTVTVRAPCVTIARQPPWISLRPGPLRPPHPRTTTQEPLVRLRWTYAGGLRLSRGELILSNFCEPAVSVEPQRPYGCQPSAMTARARRHALVPSLPAGSQGEPRRRSDRQPQADAAGRPGAPDRRRDLRLAAARLPRAPEDRT